MWAQTVIEGREPEKRRQILDALVEYGKLDTLAMVEILRVLQNVAV